MYNSREIKRHNSEPDRLKSRKEKESKWSRGQDSREGLRGGGGGDVRGGEDVRGEGDRKGEGNPSSLKAKGHCSRF